MHRIRTLLALAFCIASAAVSAQWQWIDKDGRTVFSDRAPPAEIPQKSILRQPAAAARATAPQAASADVPARAASAAASLANDPTPDAAVPKLGTVDKDLVERKKQADAQAAAKMQADAERISRAKAESCERARANRALMESGVRVSVTNAKGEREIIDDAARAAEVQRTQTVINANCN